MSTPSVLALHFAQREGRRGDHFLGLDDRSLEPHDTAYFLWLVRTEGRTVLIDAGIGPAVGHDLPGLAFYEHPVDLLARAGVQPDDVDVVVLTHLHYDHTGVVADLPRARVVVQEQEWDYWHGPWERVVRERWLRSRDDLAALEKVLDDERLVLAWGDLDVAPGVSAHLVGGHTPGMQVVRVAGRRPVVVASDASHFYENLEQDHPAPLLHSMSDVYAGYDRVRALAGVAGDFLPGHDPEVLERFPARFGDDERLVVVR